MRTPQEVFDNHLSLRAEEKLEEDLRLNYSENVVVFCVHGLHFGHDGVRCTAGKLREVLPSSDFTFKTRLVQGDVAYLEWTGKDKDVEVMDGCGQLRDPRWQDHGTDHSLHCQTQTERLS